MLCADAALTESQLQRQKPLARRRPRLIQARWSGEWQELVQALKQSWFPASSNDPNQLADKSRPCKGAVARIHSHFFTESGQFGPRNHEG
jgi:hypothetical protein